MLIWTRSLVVVVVVAAVGSLASCGDNFEGPPDAPPEPACSDGQDNDLDGFHDFPEDIGCDSPTSDREDAPVRPHCSDGRDNDGDGLEDYPNDPGCLLPESADEDDDCPDGPFCPQCANGVDDDVSGARDFPGDTGCDSAADNFEYAGSPQACGTGLTLKQLPASGMDMGMLGPMSVSNIPTPCGGGGGVPGTGYVMVLDRPAVVVISTADSIVDTVLDLRRPPCQDSGSALACHDDVSAGNRTSRIVRSLATGVYYIIVQGKTAAQVGPYTLSVQKFRGEGEMCTVQSDCGPDLVCRVPVGDTQRICTDPVCSDGLDDDGDGDTDYPNDPGCLNNADPDETDDCPSGPMCPDCSDGIDNDGDGQIDYPTDTSCVAASSMNEACTGEVDPIQPITAAATMDTMVGAADNHNPTCGSDGGPDKLFTLELPAMQLLTIDTIGSPMNDTILSLMTSSCTEPGLACDDNSGGSLNSRITRANVPAGNYVVAVDAWSSSVTPGPFNLNISGTIAPGGSCEGTLAQAGAISCGGGFVCAGPAGVRTCISECTDGIDNNGDGTIDFPADPGCAAPNDNLEDTVCPGPMCPVCSDGLDNDGDGSIDYPADPSCFAASSGSESCSTSEAIDSIVAVTTTGTTAGLINDYKPPCGAANHTAPDVMYQLDVPALQSLTLNLVGFDGATALLDASCSPTPIACSDPASTTIPNLAAGRYFVVVDGWSSGSGAYTLTTTGVIPPLGDCESPLVAAGVLSCPGGMTCQGPAGARRCISECSDGIDNNGDGNVDYPIDPGCDSLTDGTESNVCPGATCPVCSNMADDDGDMVTDFPADLGCKAAAGASEAFCAVEPDFAGVISQPTTSGTLALPAAGHYNQSCQANTGADVAYALSLPVLVRTLRIDTIGSIVQDTVLSVKDAQCSAQLGCDDDGDPAGNLSLLNLTNVQPGNYAIQVDSYNSNGANNGPFKLNVRGTVDPGAACTSPLFASGVLVCGGGTSCTAGICQ